MRDCMSVKRKRQRGVGQTKGRCGPRRPKLSETYRLDACARADYNSARKEWLAKQITPI
jgi:hypothetical protein